MFAFLFVLRHSKVGTSVAGRLKYDKQFGLLKDQESSTRVKSPTGAASILGGSDLRVSFVRPRGELRPYIKAVWILESAFGLPQTDTNLAAPNGSPKLIILCENSLETTALGQPKVSGEGLYVVGNRDVAVFVRSAPRRTSLIGIEFRPHGAFPLFGIPMDEIANRVFEWETIFGSRGRAVSDTFRNLPSMAQKLDFIQAQLVRLLDKNHRGNCSLINYCVKELELTAGRLMIKDLEQTTGYTRRYLELLFGKHVGFSPKVLAGIFRFQRFYRKWACGLSYDSLRAELYDYYYDQAHFTREFKRMTGYSPRKFSLQISNEFGRRLSLK